MDKGTTNTRVQIEGLCALIGNLAQSLDRDGKTDTAVFLRERQAILANPDREITVVAHTLEYLSRSAPMSQYAGLTKEQDDILGDILRISATLSDSMKA